MELKYKKDCDLDVMSEILKLNPLYDDFKSVSMSNFNGTDYNIRIETKRHFYSHEEDVITGLIESYSNSHPLKIRKSLEDKISTPAIIIGQGIIAKYAAMNLYAGKSALAIIEVMTVTKDLIRYLQTGSLELALYELIQIKDNLPESGTMTAPECDEFIRRLQVEIAILKG